MRTFCFSSSCFPYSLAPRGRDLGRAPRSRAIANFWVCVFSNTEAPSRFAILYLGPVFMGMQSVSVVELYAAGFRRARTVVGYRRRILDAFYLNALPGKSAERRLASGTDPADDDRCFLETDERSLFAEKLSHLRGGVGRRLAGAGESERARWRRHES